LGNNIPRILTDRGSRVRALVLENDPAEKMEVEQALTGVDLYITLSRCAYLAGITFQTEGMKSEASVYYDQGIAWTEDSLSVTPTSKWCQYLVTNIALSCLVRLHSYALWKKHHGKTFFI
jgi:hypothetical protein